MVLGQSGWVANVERCRGDLGASPQWCFLPECPSPPAAADRVGTEGAVLILILENNFQSKRPAQNKEGPVQKICTSLL